MVEPHETLFVIPRKRFVPVYEAGELTLHVGQHEISFDEPELFPWAEKLIEQDSFLASAAAGWSPTPLEWPRVQSLLADLIDAGILSRAPSKGPGAAPSPKYLELLELERMRRAPERRFWTEPELLREHGIEEGYLEAVVPVFRLAHIAVDREGRQVGELNTFPPGLRLKVPTEWKTCAYAGSRYHDELPMNMTALKSMLAHWKPVLSAALAFRAELLKRRPQPPGQFRLGDLLFLTSGILAWPALLMLRRENPVRTGELDPVLSSLFRVVDGVRMVAAHMLDLYERPLFHDSLVTAADITAHAEAFGMYQSDHGVCAGPQAMIDELLAALFEGKSIESDWRCPWTAEIPAAIDYALLGRQLTAVTSTVGVRMGLAYARIHEALSRTSLDGLAGRLRQAIALDFELLVPSRAHLPEQRHFSERHCFHDMFDQARLAMGGPASFADVMSPPAGLLGARASVALGNLFASICEPSRAGLLREIAGYVVDYLRFERNALRTVAAIQREINDLLGRPQPRSPLGTIQLASAHKLRQGTHAAARYLIDTLREVLGVEIVNQSDSTIATHRGVSIALE